ncbi:MAG TPA: CocE/NonD family hydrolase [Actinomycetota bacterium]|nr:CocE/NonD family hydrolase [Actinomycetota bacterium]
MRAEEHRIPLADGTHLAATLYLPGEGTGPWPAILEYLPYRKDDWTLERDLELYPYVVDRGYVGARVDIRGTGRSDGRLPDGEYSEQEQRDGLEVIEWLATRPWSNGSVGMWGISWGGFNAIQLAMRQPPALKAIVAVDASDDLFHLDIHYIDGIWHLDEYELGIDLWNAVSPAPDFPTDEETLAARFDAEPWLPSWLRHQRDGPFWRRGSLAPDYDRLRIPAFLVGGFLDGYRDSIPRMLEAVPAPTRAIVGPWNHAWPHAATPGPEIEWREEIVRWWERWLKDGDTGIDRDPPLAVYLREAHPTDPELRTVPGSWRWEDWPIEGSTERVLHLGPGGTLIEALGSGPAADRLPYRPSAGAEAGAWWGELPVDQAPLDATCLVYETAPLEEPLAVIGMPSVTLLAGVDAPLAHFFARLCDVFPDGRVTLVTGGGRNGAHRRSPEHPAPLEPGRAERIDVPMRFTSWVFPPGHRIRVAVSNHLWPMMWPTPHRMTMTLHVGRDPASRLTLPVVPLETGRAPSFRPPERTPRPGGIGSRGETSPGPWRVDRDRDGAAATWDATSESWFQWGRFTSTERLEFRVADHRPDLASARGDADVTVDLPGRRLAWRVELDLRSDRERFRYRFRRTLVEDDRVIRRRAWEESVPRDFQ